MRRHTAALANQLQKLFDLAQRSGLLDDVVSDEPARYYMRLHIYTSECPRIFWPDQEQYQMDTPQARTIEENFSCVHACIPAA
jgi:hypothetical protein